MGYDSCGVMCAMYKGLGGLWQLWCDVCVVPTAGWAVTVVM